jgi:hypothetical protein
MPALADTVRGACLAAKSDWPAALAQLRKAYGAGCHHPLCLRWLTVASLGNGELESALPVLDEWRRAEPNHPEMLTYLAAIAAESGSSEGEISTETTLQAPTDRQYRLDQGTTTSEITPMGLPIVHQFSSLDFMLPAENG